MTNFDKAILEINEMNLEEIAPNYKKGILNQEEIDRIIYRIASDIGVSEGIALAGTILLMLKGAASSGTPQTMSVDLVGGKTLAKKNITGAYVTVTGNSFIRRLAESLAIQIGEFAERHGLEGELSQRIGTVLKAETGELLTYKEKAWCSSFSQNIPDLPQRSSERLAKLLAADYRRRFEGKRKSSIKIDEISKKRNKKGKK